MKTNSAKLTPGAGRATWNRPGTVRLLNYRSSFFGSHFSGLLGDVFESPSDWTTGELQLFGTFVSRLNRCPY